MTSTSSSTSHLASILGPLAIPSEYGYYDKIIEQSILVRLDEWKKTVEANLAELRDWINQRDSEFSVKDQAAIVSVAAALYGEAPWISSESRELVEEILKPFSDPPAILLESILNDYIKPIFKTNPHPSLNPSTGRKLPENTGGHLAYQDYYDGQVWKRHPGVANILSWCVLHTEKGMYESLWHLIIPPVMTLQDDYEAPYKLQGILITYKMIERVPKDLLRRTGVDELLFSSLNVAMTNLHNPITPALLRATIRTFLALVDLCTPVGSQVRFEKLCALLGDCIIGNVWMYASQELDTIQATLNSLPEIVELLGIGCARYLKGLIPQLTHPLLPKVAASSTSMQIASLRALSAIVTACAPRMHRWKGTVLEAAAKCWVSTIDLASDDSSTRELQEALRCLCVELGKACPSMYQDEYPKLLSLDPMFQGLVGTVKL
ncbi:hypothetical protein FIBSPDRAFT_919497 [Athelia psychrophila]|uniref:ARM repeat-containing protein n=1 Tax=Athelia psychrophila TaxID=1759441 RepID=A0A166KBB2_9AGAM|nr:hypothetical protein FIBSPDRAFT_919497 [Fibularhizoctonia sp. CBS 109695]